MLTFAYLFSITAVQICCLEAISCVQQQIIYISHLVYVYMQYIYIHLPFYTIHKHILCICVNTSSLGMYAYLFLYVQKYSLIFTQCCNHLLVHISVIISVMMQFMTSFEKWDSVERWLDHELPVLQTHRLISIKGVDLV